MAHPGRRRKRAPAFGRREQKKLAERLPVVAERLTKQNRPPKDDKDAKDIPALPDGSMIPWLASVVNPVIEPKAHAKRKQGEPESAPGNSSGPKRKRRRSRAPDDDKAKDVVAAVAKQCVANCTLPVPKQKPGESAKAFALRVDEWTKQKLRGTQSKANTSHMKEKKRERAKAQKTKAAHRQAGVMPDEDGLFKKGERAAFGSVVKRPPILSAAAMKSRSKLKAKVDGESSGKELINNTSNASEFESYAAKVREAYAAIKAKRLVAGGRG